MIALDRQELDHLLLKEKQRLAELPYFERNGAEPDYGVLLSDRIEHYCGPDFKLICPFEKECLRPAVRPTGEFGNYAMGGKTLHSQRRWFLDHRAIPSRRYSNPGNPEPSRFSDWEMEHQSRASISGSSVGRRCPRLIEFRGRLSCPLQSLDGAGDAEAWRRVGNDRFRRHYAQVGNTSIAFQWWNNKKKLVFQQYRIELQSGVALRLKEIDQKVDTGQQRMTTLSRPASSGRLGKSEHSIANRYVHDTFLLPS